MIVDNKATFGVKRFALQIFSSERHVPNAKRYVTNDTRDVPNLTRDVTRPKMAGSGHDYIFTCLRFGTCTNIGTCGNTNGMCLILVYMS